MKTLSIKNFLVLAAIAAVFVAFGCQTSHPPGAPLAEMFKSGTPTSIMEPPGLVGGVSTDLSFIMSPSPDDAPPPNYYCDDVLLTISFPDVFPDNTADYIQKVKVSADQALTCLPAPITYCDHPGITGTVYVPHGETISLWVSNPPNDDGTTPPATITVHTTHGGNPYQFTSSVPLPYPGPNNFGYDQSFLGQPKAGGYKCSTSIQVQDEDYFGSGFYGP